LPIGGFAFIVQWSDSSACQGEGRNEGACG
jgi:hypothetical protein